MHIPYYVDLIGVFAFGLSGALAARGKQMYVDIFGVSFTAFTTAIGGGTLRDVILDIHPLSWIRDGNYFIVIGAAVFSSIFFSRSIAKIPKTIFLVDTVGISLYTILGVQKSLAAGVNPIAAVILGMVSAVFGGVIRDTLINEIPIIFRKEIYATACLAGAFLYILLNFFGFGGNISFFSSIGLIVLIRVISVKYRIALPKIRD